MAAPVLTLLEQKAAISGKKIKKKTIKNVLSIPINLTAQSCVLEISEIKKLTQILERLLPTARLPNRAVQQNAKVGKNSNEKSSNHSDLSTEAKMKRNQLSLGVNVLNKNIRNDLISAALFACDIEPKFLIEHLCSLCSHKKIPFLHLPGLREITKNNLGFPCIAVGFKKNFCDFSEAIEEIQSIFQSKQVILSKTCLETKVESSNSEEEEIDSIEDCGELEKNDEFPFTYLCRTSVRERIFVPEKLYSDKCETKSKSDFLALGKDDSDSESKTKLSHIGMKKQFKKQHSKFKKFEELVISGSDDDDDDDYEDFEVPKKEIKKNWVIDKTGDRHNIRYFPANLMRIPSNPNRMRKNK